VIIAYPDFQAVGGPVAAAFGMANNPSSKLLRHCKCDPIETSTGNFTEDVIDLSVPGRGVPLHFSRTYNSLMAATNGPLGYGWTHSYNMSLSLGSGSPPVTATVNQENGTQVDFSVSGTAYTAAPRVLASFVHNGDGSFTFTRRATQIFVFNAGGQLTAEKELNGYTTSLAYNGSNQLTTVTDLAGRTLTLTWSNGHITSVADTASPPRTVSFQYNDGAGNLTDVIDAAGGHSVYTYDTSHRLVAMRAPKFYGDTTTTPTPVTTNHYDANGRVDWQSDPLGNKTTFSYTDYSTTITDPKGNIEVEQYRHGVLLSDTKGSGTPQAATWIYNYDPATLSLTSVTDPNGHTSTSTVDAAGNLLTSTDALNRTTASTYNGLNEPLTLVDAKGVTSTMTYDISGNLRTRFTPLLDGSGHTIGVQAVTYTYGDSGHPGDITAVTDPNNKTSSFGYNANGDLTGVTDTVGDKTTYAYDGVGRRTSMVSPNGNVAGGNASAHTTTYGTDAFGRVTSTVDQLGHQQVRNIYDGNGNLVTGTDADNNATAHTYNPGDQLTLTTRADHTTLRTGYDVLGSLVTQTDAAGSSTIYAYNDAALTNKATSIADPLGRTTNFTYDRAGNLLTKQDPGGNCSATPKTGCTSFGYDAANEQTSITYSDGVTPNVTNTVFDSDGQRTQVSDGTGTSSSAFDSLHRLTSSTNGANSTVGYGYDLKGKLTTITYPGTTGSVSRGYDDAGRLHTVRDWANNTTTFNYDADSNLVSTAYPNATTTTNTVDAADRVMGIAASPNSAPSSPFVSFTYGRDAVNQVSSVTSTGVPADNNSYSYSQLNQLTGVNAGSYAYDTADNLTQLAAGASQTFDAANEVTGTVATVGLVAKGSGGDSNASTTVLFSAPVLAGDQILVATTQASGAVVATPSGYSVVGSYSSGPGGASTIVFRRAAAGGESSVGVGGSVPFAKSITVAVYRGVDPNTPIEAQATAGATASSSVTVPSVTTTVANDRLVLLAGAGGNLLPATWTPPAAMTEVTSNSSQSLTTADLSDQVIPVPGATGSRTATLSSAAQLVGVLLALRPAVVTYSYDLRGNRTAINPLGASTVTLAYDQANRLTGYGTTATYAYNGDGLRMSKTLSGATSRFTWDVADGLPLALVDGTTNYVYGPGGLPLEQVSSSGTLFYYQDQLGSTRALATSVGTVTATYTYDAYGRLTGSTGNVSNPFGYGGQYTDAESGLIYLRARYYDPGTGQFLTRDPLLAITGEPYNYVANNPLNGSDPLGASWWSTALKVTGVVVGVAAVVVAATALTVGTGGLDILVAGSAISISGGALATTSLGLGVASEGLTYLQEREDCHAHLNVACSLDRISLVTGGLSLGLGGLGSLSSLAPVGVRAVSGAISGSSGLFSSLVGLASGSGLVPGRALGPPGTAGSSDACPSNYPVI
jgi:RHS repeat-associated protein